MTEPQGGADPGVFTTTARLDGDEWVINGEKWFSSHAGYASFLIVMAVTDPAAPLTRSMSMFIVPTETPGFEILRETGLYGEPAGEGSHPYVRYNNVRVPTANLLGEAGNAFAVAQVRLGGGRVHHAMRTVGAARRILDAMCERAVSRTTKGELLGNKQLVQDMIAQSWIQLEQFRLLVLRTAWRIDKVRDYKAVRGDIAAVKIAMTGVLRDITLRAIQVHGSLGVTSEMSFARDLIDALVLGLADGPTEVHVMTLCKQILKDVQPSPGLFPSGHFPARLALAREKFGV